MWEYIGAKLALVVPSAVVLAGWRAFPWGQLGKGPISPSLQPILVSGTPMEMLEEFINVLMHFSEQDTCPPMYRISGFLRPFIHAVSWPRC